MYKDIICGIYSIENVVNHKKYIGQSINIKSRWCKHKVDLNNGSHDNDYLQKSWNKYGENNFEFEILEECSKEELNEKERYYERKESSAICDMRGFRVYERPRLHKRGSISLV